MQINPPLPSFIILSKVSLSFSWASSGILYNLFCSSSFTSSCKLFPKILDSQIFLGSFSNSDNKYFTNSSDCFSLPTSDENIGTTPGDIVLYQGDKISLFYGSHSWSYTKLGKIDNVDSNKLKEVLGSGDGTLEFSLK